LGAAVAAAALSIRSVGGLGSPFFRRGRTARRGGVRLERKEKRPISQTPGDLHLPQYMVLRFVAIDS
jgi:hypothetical protein